jgi:hypothetical protein
MGSSFAGGLRVAAFKAIFGIMQRHIGTSVIEGRGTLLCRLQYGPIAVRPANGDPVDTGAVGD